MNLIIDFYQLGSIQILSESKNDGTMKIRGIFGKAEEFNNNNRRYPKSILEREVNKLIPLVNESRLLGEIDHPETANVKLTNAAHLVTKLYWQGNTLIGESKLLNTPAGKVAQQLLKDGVKLGVSSRGLGTLSECKEFPGKLEVNEDYKMVTFDLVADPSTKGAFPSPVNESVLLEKTRKEAFSQQLILKLFESKLAEIKENKIHKLFEGSLGIKRTARFVTSQNTSKKEKKHQSDKTFTKMALRPSMAGPASKKFQEKVAKGKRKKFKFANESKLSNFMHSINEGKTERSGLNHSNDFDEDFAKKFKRDKYLKVGLKTGLKGNKISYPDDEIRSASNKKMAKKGKHKRDRQEGKKLDEGSGGIKRQIRKEKAIYKKMGKLPVKSHFDGEYKKLKDKMNISISKQRRKGDWFMMDPKNDFHPGDKGTKTLEAKRDRVRKERAENKKN